MTTGSVGSGLGKAVLWGRSKSGIGPKSEIGVSGASTGSEGAGGVKGGTKPGAGSEAKLSGTGSVSKRSGSSTGKVVIIPQAKSAARAAASPNGNIPSPTANPVAYGSTLAIQLPDGSTKLVGELKT